ncbi:MAG: DUF559 domain-containing protein [Pirellulales bacterium]|nr:DUF559 domain-containing protein [Pirellulales bacterium]
MSDAEQRLWLHLRCCQMNGIKFRRQAPIGAYVVDFVAYGKKLVIELDGGQHSEKKGYDTDRTRWLNSQGFRVIRFWNDQIFEELDGVLEKIWDELHNDRAPLPGPPHKGEGE